MNIKRFKLCTWGQSLNQERYFREIDLSVNKGDSLKKEDKDPYLYVDIMIKMEIDQYMIISNLVLPKEARTIMINHDPIILVHHILQDVLDVSVQHVRRVPGH